MLLGKAIKIKSPAQSGTFFINNNGNTCGDGASMVHDGASGDRHDNTDLYLLKP